MMCAEQAVEKREVDREILVDRDLLYRMMPVVEARRRDDAAEMVEIAAQIGVEQRGVDIDEADIGLHHRWREAEGEQRQGSHAAQGDDLEEMHARPPSPTSTARKTVVEDKGM